MAGVLDSDQREILQTFPFGSGSLPVRYLGLPLLTKKMTAHDYSPLIEKIKSKISCWTQRFLSFAGRLQLIGSVIHSLTNFWMAAFRLPSKCIKEIDKIFSAFLWSGPDLNPHKAKVSWCDVCKPREEGGLGLRSLKEVNKVTCLKLIWRIVSGESLWISWIRKYIIRKGSFWSVKESSTLGSWIWKKLLKYRDLARSFIKTEVGNGRKTSFWFDSWSTLGRIYSLTDQRGIIDLGIETHATMETVLETHRRRRHRNEFLTKIEDEIDIVRTQRHERDDRILWRNSAGNFIDTFKSKDTWLSIRNASPRCHWSDGIWFQYATPRYSLLAWLAILDKLSTNDRIARWNPTVNQSCILCQNAKETRNHLFFQCVYVGEIWGYLVKRILGNRYYVNWYEVLQLLTDDTVNKRTLFLVRYSFQMIIHSFWMERNGRKHGETPKSSNQLAKVLEKNVRNRLSSIRLMGDRRFNDYMEAWLVSR